MYFKIGFLKCFGPRERSGYLKNDRLADRGVVLQLLALARGFCVLCSVQTGSHGSSSVLFNGCGTVSQEAKRPAVKLSNHFLLVPGLKWMVVPYNFTPLMTSQSAQENLDVLGPVGKQVLKQINSFVISVRSSVRQEQLVFH